MGCPRRGDIRGDGDGKKIGHQHAFFSTLLGPGRTFRPKATRGLRGLLVDGLRVDRALSLTSAGNLWPLPAGTIPPDPVEELLGSGKMRALLNQPALALTAWCWWFSWAGPRARPP